jgi:hypothetical protein
MPMDEGWMIYRAITRAREVPVLIDNFQELVAASL